MQCINEGSVELAVAKEERGLFTRVQRSLANMTLFVDFQLLPLSTISSSLQVLELPKHNTDSIVRQILPCPI